MLTCVTALYVIMLNNSSTEKSFVLRDTWNLYFCKFGMMLENFVYNLLFVDNFVIIKLHKRSIELCDAWQSDSLYGQRLFAPKVLKNCGDRGERAGRYVLLCFK